MYTEDQAREKWCPFARTAIGGVGLEHIVVNRTALGYGDAEEHRCIASQCMAWRWHEKFGEWKMPDGTAVPDTVRSPHDVNAKWHDARTGSCGLAGTPS